MDWTQAQVQAMKELDPSLPEPMVVLSSKGERFQAVTAEHVMKARMGKPIKLRVVNDDTVSPEWAGQVVFLKPSPKDSKHLCVTNDDNLYNEFTWMQDSDVANELNAYSRVVDATSVDVLYFDEDKGCYMTKEMGI